MSLVSKQYLLALSTGEPIVLFNLGERLVGTFFRSCLIRCLFSLGAAYHCSDVVTGVGTGSPSEIGGMFFIWLGIIPGVLLRVFRLCTLGVCRMSSGCVGFVDVCGCWSDGWSCNCSVSFANILANAALLVPSTTVQMSSLELVRGHPLRSVVFLFGLGLYLGCYCVFFVCALSVFVECLRVALGLLTFVAVGLTDGLAIVPFRLRIFWPTPLRQSYVFPGFVPLIPAIFVLLRVSLSPPSWRNPSVSQWEVHNVGGKVDIVLTFGCLRWMVLGTPNTGNDPRRVRHTMRQVL